MDFKDTKAIYLQIAERIEDEILQGKYPEGSRIPSVREYAATVEVNVNTMMRSFEYLQSHDIIRNKRGIGYFTADGAVAAIRRVRKETFMKDFLPELFRQMRLLAITPEEVMQVYTSQK